MRRRFEATTPRSGVLEVLTYRNPNWVSLDQLFRDLPSFSRQQLIEAVKLLVEEEDLLQSDVPRGRSGIPPAHVRFQKPGLYPIREEIHVKDFRIKRLMTDENVGAFPEQFNMAVEELALYAEELEARVDARRDEVERRYWGTVVSLFGVFAAVIALVVTGVQTLEPIGSMEPWALFRLQAAQLLPLAGVLGVFVVVLRFSVLGFRCRR